MHFGNWCKTRITNTDDTDDKSLRCLQSGYSRLNMHDLSIYEIMEELVAGNKMKKVMEKK